MEKLSEKQIKKLLEERPNKKLLDAAIRHENRLSLHSEMIVHKEHLSPYYTQLLLWLGSEQPELLPKDKIERFKQLCTTPIATLGLTDAIFADLSRIFTGVDAFYRCDYKDPDTVADWLDYRDDEFWKVQGFAAMKSAINSVWVAEIPAIQKGAYPEPKNRLINIRNIIDIENEERSGNTRHCCFTSGDILFIYDPVAIRAYDYKDGKLGTKLADVNHGLGYTPARMFWSDAITTNDPINKRAPLTPVLSDLDWLLVHKTFKKYMDMSNAYPIVAAYEQSDDFENDRRDNDQGRTHEQKANTNYNMGPGTYWGVRPPLQGEPDLMSNPVKLISPDVATLEFHVTEEERLSSNILKRVVGVDSEATKMAQNEKQVMSGFESRTSVLRRIAHNFERIQTFADTTLFTLRYGKNPDISVDMGSRYFLRTTDDLIADLADAKEKGAHDAVVDMLSNEVIETKFRNDKSGYERAMIVRALDPLPDKSVKDAIEIYKEGGIDKVNFVIKCNLTAFVHRFERDFAPLNVFAPDNSKIDLIKEQLKVYANEYDTSKQRPEDTDKGEGSVLLARGTDPEGREARRGSNSSEDNDLG